MRAFYFGCESPTTLGHYLYGEDLQRADLRLRDLPWGYAVDGALAPKLQGGAEAPQGVAALHHKDGWTAISFWDRTADSRFGSSSTFLFDDRVEFEQGMRLAQQRYPTLFERFTFPIQPA